MHYFKFHLHTFSFLQKTFLQAKTFTKNTSFFGKAFFSKERFVLKEKLCQGFYKRKKIYVSLITRLSVKRELWSIISHADTTGFTPIKRASFNCIVVSTMIKLSLGNKVCYIKVFIYTVQYKYDAQCSSFNTMSKSHL